MFQKLYAVYQKYGFLLSQLVKRDFKTKYRRSVLGVLWSLLNPLLTMTVQYLVFSSLFRFGIPNYAVYLLIGVVMFGYMQEATTLSMSSIVQNAGLINKVYVPKYIYPFSRVLSSGVNFLLSMLALYIVVIFSGLHVTAYHFAILYGIACLFAFICGLSLFLAAIMVFFRDTQFLYSVIITMWSYLTPIFYPESILPSYMLSIVKCNPMFQFINFVRMIILYNKIPGPETWVICFIFAFIPLVYGVYIFKCTQKDFILYL